MKGTHIISILLLALIITQIKIIGQSSGHHQVFSFPENFSHLQFGPYNRPQQIHHSPFNPLLPDRITTKPPPLNLTCCKNVNMLLLMSTNMMKDRFNLQLISNNLQYNINACHILFKGCHSGLKISETRLNKNILIASVHYCCHHTV